MGRGDYVALLLCYTLHVMSCSDFGITQSVETADIDLSVAIQDVSSVYELSWNRTGAEKSFINEHISESIIINYEFEHFVRQLFDATNESIDEYFICVSYLGSIDS